jgi:hypothetical protein
LKKKKREREEFWRSKIEIIKKKKKKEVEEVFKKKRKELKRVLKIQNCESFGKIKEKN